jgi:hypothetical protein
VRWYRVVKTTKEVQTLCERAPHCYIIRAVIALLSVKVEVVVLKEITAVVLTRILASSWRQVIGKLVRGDELHSHRQAVSVRFRKVRREALNVHPVQ